MVWKFPNNQILVKEQLLVKEILEEEAIQIKFELLSDIKSLENSIETKLLYRPQFLLAGIEDTSPKAQIQIFAKEEIDYLESLSIDNQIISIQNLIKKQVPCIILTSSYSLPNYLLELLIKANIAILKTDKDITVVRDVLSDFLIDHFAPQMIVHGTFTDIHGVGILFVGKSAIGKSEIALDLVERGHRLVADDSVMLTNKQDATIMGTSTRIAKHFMEIRGVGIIDVRAMFGIRSVRFQKRLEVIVELVEYDASDDYTRTGLESSFAEVMGVQLSYVKLPIYPGKNITVIAEAIALNYLLRTYGYNPAKVMAENLQSVLMNEPIHEDKFKIQRLVNYFQGDTE
jgi:HPr kinase/phosphorylase